MTADYLQVLALDLLDAAADGLALARTGHAAPTRQYVSHGPPAVDGCDDPTFTGQLTVHYGRPAIRQRSAPDRPAVPRSLEVAPVGLLVIQLWRCYPTVREDGAAPDTATLNNAADSLNRDLWCMMTQIYGEHFVNPQTLFTGASCSSVSFGDPSSLGSPQGGTAGWEWTIEVGLNDAGP